MGAAGPRFSQTYDRAVGLPRGRGEPRQRQRAPRARRLGDARRRRPDGRAPDGVGHDERLIDAETKKLVQQAYDHCYETLSANKELMQVLVDRLVDKETVNAGEFQQMVLEHTSSEKFLAGAATV